MVNLLETKGSGIVFVVGYEFVMISILDSPPLVE
jgi:hypothetical protein